MSRARYERGDLTDRRLVIPAHGVLYFKYLSVLLQEMTVEVDEDFLFALLEFTKFRSSNDTPERS